LLAIDIAVAASYAIAARLPPALRYAVTPLRYVKGDGYEDY